jgi:lysophospholipase L1-like esterase
VIHLFTRSNKVRSVGAAVIIAIAVLAVVEIALQIRAQQRTGESVFSLMLGQSTYTRHPQLDLRILRPSSIIKGTRQTIVTNRYGLRGEDFEPDPPPGELRIALLGASTIMGANAPTDDQTSSAALQRLLNAQMRDDHKVRVVNAGLGGTTLLSQSLLLARLLPGMGIKQVVWYPGTNDIGCVAAATATNSDPVRLPWLAIPKWTLTADLIVKNTAFLRRNNAAAHQSLRPDFDPAIARRQLVNGIVAARKHHLSVVLVTSATSFRSDMPDSLISSRAASALFFRPCLTGPALAAAVDELNDVLRKVADETGVPIIDAARLFPPDSALFGDASHFSIAGEEFFAAVLAGELKRQGLLTDAAAP